MMVQYYTRETKMTVNEMPVPEWVEEVKGQMFDAHKSANYEKGEIKKRDLPVIEDFSNLFAEYELRDKDLLVHVFPRNGGEDHYWPCEYKEDGTYIPSRLEEVIKSVTFPIDIVNRIKEAADKVWQGDVAIDKATILHYGKDVDITAEDPEEVDLQAYAVQFQHAANTVKTLGALKFIDQFCEELDKLLEPILAK